MLAIIGGLIGLYFLNAIIISLVFDITLSLFGIVLLTIFEFILAAIFPNVKTSSKKRVNKRGKSNLSAEKFHMFEDINKRK